MSTHGHTLVATIDSDSGSRIKYKIECPHTGIDRECAVWYQIDTCKCSCESCQAGDHDDCEEETIPEVGTKWCQAEPADDCWYKVMMEEAGTDAFHFGTGIVLRATVQLNGYSNEDPIEVLVETETWYADAVTKAVEEEKPPVISLHMVDTIAEINRRVFDGPTP